MPSFEGSDGFCLVDCEFGSRRLKIESSVVVACEGWLSSVRSSEIGKIPEAVERCRLSRSSISETAAEMPGFGCVLRVDLSALLDNISEFSLTD